MSREQLIQTLWGENRGKLLLMLILLGLLTAVQLWQGLWVEPRRESSRLQLRQVQSELSVEQQRIASGGGVKITGLSDDVAHFYQMVPPRSGLGSFIGRLYSYAGTSGIDIAQITYGAKAVKGAKLQTYQLSFKVNGRYGQIKKFIQLLENSPSVLILQRISLGGTREKNKEVVGLQLQLQTFFREGV